ncbi:peptidase M20 [Chitinophaga silvatica]|uniref:Peptidase M20 n=1 Tax=Chitinophaga silvatica TaxID=2282649 RepID=A0A3E1YBH7_9BACT|nr:M28 family peptidase [Chitinophaga silvatica]RFS23378.1 peptidase M20 [Chitinophaga silvatica]
MKWYCFFFCMALGSPAFSQKAIDSSALMKDVQKLSSDQFEGRKTGTKGSRLAQFYIIDRFKQIGIKPFNGTFEYPFFFQKDDRRIMGTNIYGYIPGQLNSVIVITAHYDHLGIRNNGESKDSIYNGADDNASGIGGLLALAKYFKQHPPRYTMIFAALDAEEAGLEGSKAFLKSPPVPIEQMRLNINMDMIAHNDKNELYVCGTYQFPDLKKYVAQVADRSSVKLIAGHDNPSQGHDDWTNQSDQYEFFQQKIPFLYFGVEDHPDYHHASDEFNTINPSFYYNAVQTILDAVKTLDSGLSENKFSGAKTMN